MCSLNRNQRPLRPVRKVVAAFNQQLPVSRTIIGSVLRTQIRCTSWPAVAKFGKPQPLTPLPCGPIGPSPIVKNLHPRQLPTVSSSTCIMQVHPCHRTLKWVCRLFTKAQIPIWTLRGHWNPPLSSQWSLVTRSLVPSTYRYVFTAHSLCTS